MNNNAIPPLADTQNVNLNNGQWVPVDATSLGFQLNAQPEQVVTGPDGSYYKISAAEPRCGGIASNYTNNAIATPSTIVQMPPIVQPIALVPFTSQNQPLLQYDPYSRPVEPEVQPKAPNYVRKPYRGVSFTALIVAIAGFVTFLVLASGVFNLAPRFNLTGLEAIYALLAIIGISGAPASVYHANRIAENEEAQDFLGLAITYALPIIMLIILVLFAVLILKYLLKIGKKNPPRGFSVCALVTLVLSIAVLFMLLSMSNAELPTEMRSGNFADFFQRKGPVFMGIGVIASLAASLLLLIIPYFSKKNAYMLEKKADSERVFIINDKQ